tara:strand:- start:283 stop:861 length:579 start_codon:yes stop_codon:yes gene_type:complete
MFERYASAGTIVSQVLERKYERLQKLVCRGCDLNQRTAGENSFTPLDAAIETKDELLARYLIDNGAVIVGSSIFDAITNDQPHFLNLFYEYDEKFWRHFRQDVGTSSNPRLNRWLWHFTALDYALAVDATNCVQLLNKYEAPRSKKFKLCFGGHYSPMVQDTSFSFSGGVNTDEKRNLRGGFYCAKCSMFVR